MMNLRGSIHEILERREDLEEPVRDKLKVTMPHVVHKVNECHIEKNSKNGACLGKDGGQQRNKEEKVVHYMLCKWMNHSCMQSSKIY